MCNAFLSLGHSLSKKIPGQSVNNCVEMFDLLVELYGEKTSYEILCNQKDEQERNLYTLATLAGDEMQPLADKICSLMSKIMLKLPQ